MDLEHARGLLFRPKTYESVRLWLKRLGIPYCDREDLAQEAMLAAYTSFDTYDPLQARPERWLNRIVVNVAAHYHAHWRAQRRRRSNTVAIDDEYTEATDESMSADERLILEQQLRTLSAHVSQLKGTAAIVRHFDVEGAPMTTIAAVHRASLGTAYRWRTRALSELRAALE